MQKNNTISLCLITLNEEEFLNNALDNVSKYVDEIIVVDGGSTDKTVEIAKKFNAKVVFNKWPGDFSLQRNLSIDNATQDWILIIDADEIYEEKLLEKLQDWTNNNIGVDAYAFPRKNYIDGVQTAAYPDIQFRFFKNNKQIKYANKVHEMLTGYKMAAYPVDLHIIHKKTSKRQEKQNNYYNTLIENK